MDSSIVADEKQCRFCLDTYDYDFNSLINPCNCNGSIKYVHIKCLFKWIYSNLDEPHEICNMCKCYYTYSINTLEEANTSFNKYIYYNTSTPLSALYLFLLSASSIIMNNSLSPLCIYIHRSVCAYYVIQIVYQTKHPWRYLYYYFKHWNIHILALCSTFITQSRYMHLEYIVAFYYFLNCCILYIVPTIDINIRKRINKKILKELLN